MRLYDKLRVESFKDTTKRYYMYYMVVDTATIFDNFIRFGIYLETAGYLVHI